MIERLDVDVNHADLVKKADSVIQRVLVFRWVTCGKHMTVPAFLKQNQKPLRLVFRSTRLRHCWQQGKHGSLSAQILC